MHATDRHSANSQGTVPGPRPLYDHTTLAMDALAAAGHMVRGFDLSAFDPVRAALAVEHAPLVAHSFGDVRVVADRIATVLKQTTRRAEARVRAEQLALRDL